MSVWKIPKYGKWKKKKKKARCRRVGTMFPTIFLKKWM